jgi:hypothetical protein
MEADKNFMSTSMYLRPMIESDDEQAGDSEEEYYTEMNRFFFSH